MYIPNYFRLQEFFPRQFYKETYPILGLKMWQIIDDRVLWTADQLRHKYGPMIVNDWLWRKFDPNANQYRGYRPPDCKIGAKFSQHRYGRALDCKFTKVNTEKVINQIAYSDPEDFNETKYITTVEIEVTWLHFDVRNYDVNKYGMNLIKP